MRFRRKADDAVDASQDGTRDDTPAASPEPATSPMRPLDISEVDVDEGGYVDLGSLLIAAPSEGREVRLQVDEASQEVQSVVIAGPDGALEIRAFAAPRGGDLWSEVRPQIAQDVVSRGGTATEEEGRFGPELVVRLDIPLPDGSTGRQDSRIMGLNGPRWFLRATLLGAPARGGEEADAWQETILGLVVNRGNEPKMSGEPLPITLPADARRTGPA